MSINQNQTKPTNKNNPFSWSSVNTIKSKLWKDKNRKGIFFITYIFEKWSVKLILHDMNGLHYYNDQTCPTLCNPMSHRLFCPWNLPGKNTGVGCHSTFQGTFPTQGLNSHLLCLLHWQADSLSLVLKQETRSWGMNSTNFQTLIQAKFILKDRDAKPLA